MSIEFAAALPVQPNRLIGREAMCAHVADLMLAEHHRMVALTGPGGVGKTHLAMCLAEDLARHFPDGAWFVPLDHLRDADLVLPAIARAIGVHEVPGQAFLDRLAETIGDRRMLLVLDNLEQVAGVAPEIGRLLARCRRLRVLGTSRAPLRLRVEREVPVDPLDTPSRDTAASAAEIGESAAVALFVERARAVRPTFTLTDDTAQVVAEICRRLDGLPLAIELAASTINVLSPQALLVRLTQRLHLLTNGAVDLPARQRSLRNAIAWSHDLLDDDERDLFERLSVLAGEFGLEAACALRDGGRDGDQFAVVSTLGRLVGKSLLYRVEAADGDARFRMLSTIQEFAAERLAASAGLRQARERLVAWALELAERAGAELTGPDQARWLAVLDQEHDNLRAALVIGQDACPVEGLRLATALWRFWATRGYLGEGFVWLERYVAATESAEDRVRARAFISMGNLALDLGAYGDAFASYTRALALFEALDDQWGVADALNGRGLVHWYRAEYHDARTAHERSLVIRREIGNRHGEANSLTNLANAVKDLGDIELAGSLHRQAYEIRASRGDRGATGFSLVNLGDVARRLGRPDEAAAHLQQSLDTFRDVNDALGQGYALLGLGHAALLAGDRIQASGRFADALAIRLQLGDRRGVIECLEGIAVAAVGEHHAEPAARLFGAASHLREQIDAPIPQADAIWLAPLLARLETTLGAAAYARHRTDGAALTMAEAAETAHAVARRIAASRRPPGGLSDREIEVLRLVANGLTNGQVADRLFLSRRTVDAHMRRIYDKLDLSTRLDVIRFAAENGIA